jgi:HlyD family type I secretion membrane fusion protein
MALPTNQLPEPDIDLPPELLDETGYNMARTVTGIVVTVVLLLTAWAAIAPVEEVAIASGKVIPSSAISDVHHLEGGTVEQTLVREGERVKRGDVLVTLRPGQTMGDVSQLEARVVNLRLKHKRLTASLNRKEPDFGPDGDRFPAIRTEHKLAFQRDLIQAEESEHQFQAALNVIEEQLKSARAEIKSLDAQVAIQAEQVAIREKSHERGYTSRNTYLQSRSVLEQTKQRLGAARGRASELEQSLEEARIKLRESQAERRSKLTEERSEVAADLAEAEESLAKQQDRLDLLRVTAPIDGIVQKLTYKTRGAVIKPGDLVAEIIPEGGVLAEVELEPKDIGHVKIGNRAEIRLSNHDINVIGKIDGTVSLISPTTFEKQDGSPYYKARITFAKARLAVAGQDITLAPGTTLTAQILTDSKSLLRYMLKPVDRSLNTAFSER